MDKGIYYHFAGLELKQFATFEDCYAEDSREIAISCKFTFAYNFSQNIVCCSTSVSITQEGDILVKADLDAFFAINSESIALISDADAVILPPELQAQFASLTYGTLRGVIFAKTLDTPFSKIVLPPNDVLEVMKTPLRIQAPNHYKS